jgi:rhodanese-related sulfurtransferase
MVPRNNAYKETAFMFKDQRLQYIIVVIINVTISLTFLLGRSADAGESPTSSAPQAVASQMDALPSTITVADAAKRREHGDFILDVRQTSEWVEYHIPGSTLIPLDELAGRQNEVTKDREVVIVCRSGKRSEKGREILMEAGFKKVTNMQGGLLQWRADGYPTVSGK